MKKLVAVSFLSILMLTGGAAFNLDDFTDSVTCNPLTAWATSECPITDRTDFSASDSLEDTIYTDAVFTADQRERVTTELRSHLNQSFGLGMAEAKQETIKEFKNGTSQSNAYITAQTEVNQLYAELERKVLVNKNREVLEFNRSLKEIQDADINVKSVYAPSKVINGVTKMCSGSVDVYDNMPEITDNGEPVIYSENVTLVNGDNIKSYGVRYENLTLKYEDEAATTGTNTCTKELTGNLINADLNQDSTGNVAKDSDKILAKSPYDSNTTAFLNVEPYRSAWTEISDTRQRAIENVDQVTTGIYSNYDEGDLKDVSVNDLLGPLELLKTASTNYEDTGLYSYSAVSLAQQGLASNQSYAFKVNWTQQDSSDYKEAVGQLFVDSDDFNRIEAGKTYNATNKGVYLAYQPDEGDAKNIQITGEFTATEITDKATGEKINQTGVQSVRFYTTNTTELKEHIESYSEQVDRVKASSSGGGVGDGLSGWFDSLSESFNVPRQYIEALAVGVIAVFIMVVSLG